MSASLGSAALLHAARIARAEAVCDPATLTSRGLDYQDGYLTAAEDDAEDAAVDAAENAAADDATLAAEKAAALRFLADFYEGGEVPARAAIAEMATRALQVDRELRRNGLKRRKAPS